MRVSGEVALKKTADDRIFILAKSRESFEAHMHLFMAPSRRQRCGKEALESSYYTHDLVMVERDRHTIAAFLYTQCVLPF